jgi:PAS domain S-box-containing protein
VPIADGSACLVQGVAKRGATVKGILDRLLLQHNPDALLAISENGEILHWNDAAEAIFGYSCDEALGRLLNDLIVPPDRRDEERRIREDALRHGLAVYESVRRRKDGLLLHVSVTTKAIRDAGGNLECFLSTKKDVTHLKVLRDAKLVESKFRDLLESTPDAIVMVNVTGRVVLINSQAENVFGYQRAEMMGQPVEMLLPQRFHAAHHGHRGQFFAQPRTRTMGAGLELYGLRKNGEEFPVEISLSTLSTEEGPMVMSAVRDLTDRKKADQKFRSLLESAPDAMVIIGHDGKIELVNSQTEKLFGYQREELLGQLVEILVPERFHAKHPGHRTSFFSQPRARSMGVGLELNARRRDGSEFPVEISLSPLDTSEGLFVSSAIRDVTDRKNFENALRQKNMELANANQAKDNFLANMSHELRTPLNAIIGFAGTLLMRLPGPLTSDQEKQLKTLQASARHLLALINDLLDVARIEAGKIELHFELVDCRSVIQEVVAALSPEAIRKELEFQAILPGIDLVVRTDRRALSQIVLNLANNALKFTDRGSVCIEVSRCSMNGKKSVEMSIRDTGKGIRPEDQSRLFEPFTQVDISKTKIREGTGLGLHLSRKLAELLRGQITFQSEYGKGSTFTLALFAD